MSPLTPTLTDDRSQNEKNDDAREEERRRRSLHVPDLREEEWPSNIPGKKCAATPKGGDGAAANYRPSREEEKRT